MDVAATTGGGIAGGNATVTVEDAVGIESVARTVSDSVTCVPLRDTDDDTLPDDDGNAPSTLAVTEGLLRDLVCVSLTVTGGPAGSTHATHTGTLGTTTTTTPQPTFPVVVAGVVVVSMTVGTEATAVRAWAGNAAAPDVTGPQQMDVALPVPPIASHWATRDVCAPRARDGQHGRRAVAARARRRRGNHGD